MDKNAVLSEQEIHEMEVAIYNDDNKTLFSLLPETMGKDSFQEEVKELIGEVRWAPLMPGSAYIVSENGDVFHSKHKRPIKLNYSPIKMAACIQGKYTDLIDVFVREGWNYDHKKVTDHLYKNDRLFIPRHYKHLFS